MVMDSFALPVEGTETRVSAQDQAYAYMFAYQELAKKAGRLENVIGWFDNKKRRRGKEGAGGGGEGEE